MGGCCRRSSPMPEPFGGGGNGGVGETPPPRLWVRINGGTDNEPIGAGLPSAAGAWFWPGCGVQVVPEADPRRCLTPPPGQPLLPTLEPTFVL